MILFIKSILRPIPVDSTSFYLYFRIAQHINFYNAISEPYKQPYCSTEGIDRVPEIDVIEALNDISDENYKPEHGLREVTLLLTVKQLFWEVVIFVYLTV